jgi:LmbE family N-acetylglucosaminyl deacetylase
VPTLALAQSGPVLVVTPSMRDCLFGAGGTLAKMADSGRAVYVVVFGNEEKASVSMGPAETRLANNEEGERAAKSLGFREVLNLGHKSGEMGHISSSEMRNQVMAMMRLYKPETMFFPDWYVHYLVDNDLYRVGRMAEEAPYGGSSLFLQDLTYMGFGGFAAREYYFFTPYRPYRPREGGEGSADMARVGIDVERKVAAILMLKSANEAWADEVRRRSGRRMATDELVRAFVEELAGAGKTEEFNHLKPRGGLPEHVLERKRR